MEGSYVFDLSTLTGVISHVGVDRQPSNIIRVDHVGVPLLAVARVMQDIIDCLCLHILTHNLHLWMDTGRTETQRGQKRRRQSEGDKRDGYLGLCLNELSAHLSVCGKRQTGVCVCALVCVMLL